METHERKDCQTQAITDARIPQMQPLYWGIPVPHINNERRTKIPWFILQTPGTPTPK
ncbi:uncharacterized protein LOC111050125 [Nilaparvata lugens]|uniref:uncharacterized protein LOC111050125 n=1 Tax=Nilaparvata lugens TaxID=108931 RepID=UPI000B98EEDD|nr:uncharacterized protein LOC111050125 [Nilaparvata lugens]